MKTTTVLCALFLLVSFSNVSAQREPPPGAGDKNLADRNIKGRSVELERIKREADKPDRKHQEPEKIPEAKFREIKEDFEQIQISQSDIVAAYTKSGVIDFAKISASAEEISKRGLRLKANLFPVVNNKKDDERSRNNKKDVELRPLTQDVKTLIVEMDNTLAAFTGNSIFTNPQVVTPDSNAKAQADLEKLIKLSAALKQEADRAVKR